MLLGKKNFPLRNRHTNIAFSLITIESFGGWYWIPTQFPLAFLRCDFADIEKKDKKCKHCQVNDNGNFYGHWDGTRARYTSPSTITLLRTHVKVASRVENMESECGPFSCTTIRGACAASTHVHFTPSFLIRTKTFGVFTGNVSRLERGTKDKSLHVTFSIYKMLKGKSLKWTWKVFLRGFSSEIVN